jgi:DNA repair protein SbcD/Mre11
MTKFAHISDVHLGGWKQQPMQDLNLNSFKLSIETCIKEKVEFVLIAGDLFDSAYPPIEILKETFSEFKKLKEAKIPCFLIAGSHDYSVSGKTFLDVLEKAGFCKNVENFEEVDEKTIRLNPTLYKGIAIYGYPGKKSGLEIPELRKIKLNDAPGMFKIFMFHTTLDKAKGTLPIDSIEANLLPKADYYAMGHLHIDFQYENFVYPGPIFPNNFQELEDLEYGSFYIVDTDSLSSLRKIKLKLKDIEKFDLSINNALNATEKIILEINKRDVEDKVVLLRLHGEIETGKQSDIKFQQIEEILKNKKAYFFLKNTHDLKEKEVEIEIDVRDSENIEEDVIKSYSKENPSDFNSLIPEIINSLSIEKQEDEKSVVFENRIMERVKEVLKI